MTNSFSHLMPKTAAPQTPAAPAASPLWDVMRSAGTGIRGGLEGLAGLPGDLGTMGNWLVEQARTKVGGYDPDPNWNAPVDMDKIPRSFRGEVFRAPSSKDIREGVTEPVIGEGYKPQTTAGEYAKTIGEFLPGAMTGPGGVVRKSLVYGAAPAVASETAGQATEGTEYEPLARTLAALGGGLAAGAAAGRAIPQTAQQTERAALVDAMDRADVHLPAAAMPDANMQGFIAGKVGQIPFLGQPLRSSADRTTNQLGQRIDDMVHTKGQGNYQAAATQTRDMLHHWQDDVAPAAMANAYDAVDRTMPGYRRHIHSPLDNTRNLRDTIRREMEVDATDSATPALDVVERALDQSPNAYPHGMTYTGIKRLRTDVGARGPKGTILPQPGTSMQAMDRLYGSLTEDLRMAAFRAGGAPAVRAWERANDFARHTKERQDQIARLIGVKGQNSPENIANRMLNMASARNAGGNLETLRTARRATVEAGRASGAPNMGMQAWDDIGAALINRISRDPTSTANVFSPDRFLTAMSKFDDDAARVLFGNDTWDQLQDLRRISEAHRSLMRKGNPSGTGGVVTMLSLATGAGVAPVTTLATVAGGLATSRILARRASRESMVNWARVRNGYVEARTPARLNALIQASKDFAPHVAMETGRDEEAVARELAGEKPAKASGGNSFEHLMRAGK